jgi:serine/threonine protein kinase
MEENTVGFRVPAPDGKKDKDGLPVMVLMENTILKGAYRTRYLTCGGMAIIYLSYRDSERYIIKEVEANDAKKVMSLTQEKSMLERLDFPGIVKVYDLFEEDGFCFLVMEYIEGMTLDRKIRMGSEIFLSESVMRDWAFQLMDIFEFLHRQKPPIIYRDLKPKNIMIDKNGRIRLIDFGIARTYKEGRNFDTDHMGSMITASPEHYGGAQTDQRSDIYTLGATLHFLATNGKCLDRDPFDFPRVKTINPKISDHLDSVIERALAVDPEERFQSIAEMRFALRGREPEESEGKEGEVKVIQDTISLEKARKPPEKEEPKIEVKFIAIHGEKNDEEPPKKKVIITLAGITIGILASLLILAFMSFLTPTRYIDWKDAKRHIGKQKTVDGVIRKVTCTHHGNAYLHFNAMSFENDFEIIIIGDNFKNFDCTGDPEAFFKKKYDGRHVRVTGTIKKTSALSFEFPSIYVEMPNQIEEMQ